MPISDAILKKLEATRAKMKEKGLVIEKPVKQPPAPPPLENPFQPGRRRRVRNEELPVGVDFEDLEPWERTELLRGKGKALPTTYTKQMIDKMIPEVNLTGIKEFLVGEPYAYAPAYWKYHGHDVRDGLLDYYRENILKAIEDYISEITGKPFTDFALATTASYDHIVFRGTEKVKEMSTIYFTYGNGLKVAILYWNDTDSGRWNKVKIRHDDIAEGKFQEIPLNVSWTKTDYAKALRAKPSIKSFLLQVFKAKALPTPKAVPTPKSVPTPKALPKVKALSPVKPIPNRTTSKSTRLNPIQQKLSDTLSFLSADLSLSSPTDVYVIIDEIKPITDKLPTTIKPLTSLTEPHLNKILSTFKTISSTYDLQDLTGPELDFILDMLKPLMDKVPNLSFKNKKAFWF